MTIGELCGLGLTLAEISELAGVYLGRPAEPIGPQEFRDGDPTRVRGTVLDSAPGGRP